MSRVPEPKHRDLAKAQREYILLSHGIEPVNYGVQPDTEPEPSSLRIVDVGKQLTEREREIMELYVEVGVQKRIGPLLGISEQTVKNHITSAYRKVGVETAIDFYRTMGWLKVPDGVPPGAEPVPLSAVMTSWSVRLR